MNLRFLAALCCVGTVVAVAQESTVLPDSVLTPRSVQPGTTPSFLTAEQKARLALKNTFSPRALANRALLAGINQWMDHPEEWQSGWKGYGQRYASRFGRLALRNAIQLSADLAFKTDPRYDRCNCTGFGSRTKHALKRVLIARRDNGGEMISVSRLAGAYVTPMITDQWYPPRLNTWEHKLESGTWFLGWRAVGNMVKEFWPEISRPIRRNKNSNP